MVATGNEFKRQTTLTQHREYRKEYWKLYDQFKLVVAQLPSDWIKDLPESILENPIVFDDPETVWIIEEEDNWLRRDCLGSSVLHASLEYFALAPDHIGILQPGEPLRIQVLSKVASFARLHDTKNIRGQSVTHVATLLNLPDLITCLLKAGVPVDSPTNTRSTALHYAAGLGHLQICQILLEYGADINATDKFNKTAIEYALDRGHDSIVRCLLHNPGIRLQELIISESGGRYRLLNVEV